MSTLIRSLKRGAEIVAVICFTAMFAGFLLQVFTRYVLDNPLDWTQEICVVLYLFGVFWTAAFLLRERDHVSFTVLYDLAPARGRRVMAAIGAAAIAIAFIADLPAAWDYISYMKSNTTPVLRLRFDLVFGIFLVFMLAVIWRAGASLVKLAGARWREEIGDGVAPEGEEFE